MMEFLSQRSFELIASSFCLSWSGEPVRTGTPVEWEKPVERLPLKALEGLAASRKSDVSVIVWSFSGGKARKGSGKQGGEKENCRVIESESLRDGQVSFQ